ncbi:MAG: hypothetical protein ACSLE4_05685 [Methyloceanibacter sp.]|uniref:hypothetical protein n=1 Tax=Methyloceanibacter sp. TaxID=1965321 RepID=UPI003EE35356
MDEDAKTQGKFIGFVEHFDGWRASFRTLKPGEVFSQEGETRMFATEPEAVKWLHTQASDLGFSSIDIRRKSDD